MLGLLLITSYSYSQENKGNGNIVKKDFQVSNINKIGNLTCANIFITQSESENLSVEIDDNLLQYLEYKSEGGIEINLKGKSISPTKFNVYVNVKGLKKIENTGSGNITSTNTIKGTQFKLEQTGSGNVDLNVSATEIKVEVTGSGNSAIKSDADFCNAEHTGSGNISLKIDNIKSSLKIEHSGSGNIDVDLKGTNLVFSNTGSGKGTIKGTSANFKLENDGSGDVNGSALTTDYCNVELSGSGDAEFNCNKEASIELNGSGDLKLKGDYKIKNIEMNGSGKLIK
jgi:hypothetical protein